MGDVSSPCRFIGGVSPRACERNRGVFIVRSVAK
jgi:hypothetical protein